MCLVNIDSYDDYDKQEIVIMSDSLNVKLSEENPNIQPKEIFRMHQLQYCIAN